MGTFSLWVTEKINLSGSNKQPHQHVLWASELQSAPRAVKVKKRWGKQTEQFWSWTSSSSVWIQELPPRLRNTSSCHADRNTTLDWRQREVFSECYCGSVSPESVTVIFAPCLFFCELPTSCSLASRRLFSLYTEATAAPARCAKLFCQHTNVIVTPNRVVVNVKKPTEESSGSALTFTHSLNQARRELSSRLVKKHKMKMHWAAFLLLLVRIWD